MMERNRYFTGKFMTARDFESEQDYTRSRHNLHNRLLHGWGILRGLDVHSNPEHRGQSVLVRAGVALDCCGREVILAKDVEMEIPSKWRDTPSEEQMLLCVYYTEEMIEITPAIFSEGAIDADAEQANRIREGASLRLVRLDEVDESCWQSGGKHKKYRDSSDTLGPTSVGSWLEPDCPCAKGVPLALLSITTNPESQEIKIDASGRRHLPISADFLTHIVHINWPHGGHMTLSHLRETLKGRLEIAFDRQIQPATENRGTGISEYTFQVQFGGVQEDIRYLPFHYKIPPILEKEHVAVFRIDPKYLDAAGHDGIKDKIVYVTLKCDFVVDSRGMPVDGTHLGGNLPTHSGRMGGTFESWFYVSDREDDRRRRSADA